MAEDRRTRVDESFSPRTVTRSLTGDPQSTVDYSQITASPSGHVQPADNACDPGSASSPGQAGAGQVSSAQQADE